jgi:hypothetical protein
MEVKKNRTKKLKNDLPNHRPKHKRINNVN